MLFQNLFKKINNIKRTFTSMLFIGPTYKNVMVRTTPIHFSSFYNKSFMKLEKTKTKQINWLDVATFALTGSIL